MVGDTREMLESLIRRLEDQRKDLDSQLSKVNSQLFALNQLLSEHYGGVPAPTVRSHHRSVREIIEDLAIENGNEFTLEQVKQKLVELQRYPSLSAAGIAAAPILSNKDLFSRIGRGQYSLNKKKTDE